MESPSSKPRDARTIEAILHSMGVEQYDPHVTNVLLELLYRYVSSVLNDARQYSEHADKTNIDADDIKLAIRSRTSFTFTQPPPRDITMRLAAERNSVPLPEIQEKAGLALPPKDFQLTAQNYKVLLNQSPTHRSPKRPRLVSSPARPRIQSPISKKTPTRTQAPSVPMNAASPARGTAARPPTLPPVTPTVDNDPDIILVEDPVAVTPNTAQRRVSGTPPQVSGALPAVQPVPTASLPSAVPPPPTASQPNAIEPGAAPRPGGPSS